MVNFKKIDLGSGKFALVDISDYIWLSKFTWHSNKHYAITRVDNKNISMHRLIMACPENLVVDHIDGHTLDNRRSNLRICTAKENGLNKGRRRNTSSIYNGVFYLKATGKYASKITETVGFGKNKKRKHTWIIEMGDERLVGYAWDVVAKSLRGEFARLNGVNVSEEEHHIIFTRERVDRLEKKLNIELKLDYKLKRIR